MACCIYLFIWLFSVCLDCLPACLFILSSLFSNGKKFNTHELCSFVVIVTVAIVGNDGLFIQWSVALEFMYLVFTRMPGESYRRQTPVFVVVFV